MLSRVRLCDPRDCSPPGSSVHGILQARVLASIPFLQGIFPTQGSNPGLLHLRQILYRPSRQGRPQWMITAPLGLPQGQRPPRCSLVRRTFPVSPGLCKERGRTARSRRRAQGPSPAKPRWDFSSRMSLRVRGSPEGRKHTGALSPGRTEKGSPRLGQV